MRRVLLLGSWMLLTGWSSALGDGLSGEGVPPTGQLRSHSWSQFPLEVESTEPLSVELRYADPTALASSDFDDDGVPDLACGYGVDGQGLVTLHRGNADLLDRSSPAPDPRPFLSPGRIVSLPIRPDFLEAGDFDGDGHADLVGAARDADTLYLLAGDGLGGFSSPERFDLSGRVSAMTAGEFNRPDGLPDLVVGVRGASGAAILLFERPGGSLLGEPRVVALPSAVSGLALGRLDASFPLDLIIAAEGELYLLRGGDQYDRSAGLPRSVHSAGATIRGVAIGDFVPESGHAEEIALLLDDGTIRLLGQPAPGDVSAASWSLLGERPLLASIAAETHPLLGAARISGMDGVELLAIDPPRRRLLASSGAALVANAGERGSDLTAEPVAMLPMRLNGDALTDLVLLTRGSDGLDVAISAPQSTFTVTNSSSSGGGSLHAAIQNANASGGADLIQFNLPGGGATPIALTSPLPAITGPVTIDGYTQPGASANTTPAPGGLTGVVRVQVNGAGAGVDAVGFDVASGGSVIRGLLIQNFDGDGIVLRSDGNFVEGNLIGTDLGGEDAEGNDDGVAVVEASNNTVGGTLPAARNLISGNRDDGIDVDGVGEVGNSFLGNLIGVNRDGTETVGNSSDGIEIVDVANSTVGGIASGAANVLSGNGSDGCGISDSGDVLLLGNLIGLGSDGLSMLGNEKEGVEIESAGCTVGGAAVGAGNVISGNTGSGVRISGAVSNGNVVAGNRIGTDAAGDLDRGNLVAGVLIVDAAGNTIGGASGGAGNLISGNALAGISLQSSGATGNLILGNRIGTDADGTQAVGNIDGIRIIGAATGNTVGGSTPGAGNVISGNTARGILISGSTNNLVQGNFIGSDADGTADLGNGAEGVLISGAMSNSVGGEISGAGNLIRGNGGAGVTVESTTSTHNPILRNSVLSNGGLGIDLGGSGVTANDAGDDDSGPNELQNFPVLNSAAQFAGDLFIQGTLDSQPNVDFRLEFFASASCDVSGHGEGEMYLGFEDITSPAVGNAVFTAILSGPSVEIASVTATVTSVENNTSEFSACVDSICVISTFPQTLLAPDPDTLAWGVPAEIRAVRGELADVSSYSILQEELLPAAGSLDISGDNPLAGNGLYYLVEFAACGSWQTSTGAEPARDTSLP